MEFFNSLLEALSLDSHDGTGLQSSAMDICATRRVRLVEPDATQGPGWER
jgi:hypothetical protein